MAKATKKSAAEIEGGAVIADLGQTLSALRTTALGECTFLSCFLSFCFSFWVILFLWGAQTDEYHTTAHRYDQAVYEKVKDSLRDKVNSNFYPLFTGSIRNLLRRIQKKFFEDLAVTSPPFALFSFYPPSST